MGEPYHTCLCDGEVFTTSIYFPHYVCDDDGKEFLNHCGVINNTYQAVGFDNIAAMKRFYYFEETSFWKMTGSTPDFYYLKLACIYARLLLYNKGCWVPYKEIFKSI